MFSPSTFLSDDKLVPEDNLNLFKSVNSDVKVVSVSGPHFILQANPEKCAEVITEEYHLRTK